jgi:hypothetical protein
MSSQQEQPDPTSSDGTDKTSATESATTSAGGEPPKSGSAKPPIAKAISNNISANFSIIGLLSLLFLIALRFAEPVGDGDLFWQMAYGKQLLEKHILIPNHTIYSWTDAHNDTIYCAWVAEIFYYLLHQLGGLTVIFAFRYAMVLGCVALAASFAHQVGVLKRCEFWLGATIFTLSSYVGTIIKPELFSYGYMSLLAWILYRMKLADSRDENCKPYIISLPILMCLWANTHGVYVFGMIAIAVFAVGELANFLLSRPLSLSKKTLQGLWIAAVVSIVTMCLTPYLLDYPLDQIREVLGISLGKQSSGDKSAYASIAAHMTIFQTPAFHFHEYLWMMLSAVWIAVVYPLVRDDHDNAGRFQGRGRGSFSIWYLSSNICLFLIGAILVFIEHRKLIPAVYLFASSLALFRAYRTERSVDVGFLLMNGVFALIYVWYLRTTFYWPPFFLYSIMFAIYQNGRELSSPAQVVEDEFLPQRRGRNQDAVSGGWIRPSAGFLALALTLFIAYRGSWEAYYTPYSSSWCGFGITYWNPVAEAEFIAKYHPDCDEVYNDYDSGGWLIWRLWPKVKVMIDPRSFPFRHFYTDYINYERGAVSIDDFQKKWPNHKPQVCIASLKNTSLWRAYMRHPDWQAAWVGPSSVVFCRRGHQYPKDAMEFMPNRFDDINNSQKCLQIFQFGIESNLTGYSWKALEVMKAKFHSPEDERMATNLQHYKNCMDALGKKDFATALTEQEQCRHIGLFYNATLLNQLYANQMAILTKAGKKANDPEMVNLFRRSERAARNEDPLQESE